MPPSREANGRARVDGCVGPRAHARRLSGASARVLPGTVPPYMINHNGRKAFRRQLCYRLSAGASERHSALGRAAKVAMKPSSEQSPREVLAGLVERVTYHNEENGFCVLRAKARGHRDVVTVVGHAAIISAGEWITASGEWVNDRTHGQQFKARFLRTSPPTSADGIEKYLSSGMIRGVGPVYAKKLLHAFGENVFDVIEVSAGSAARGQRHRPGAGGGHCRRMLSRGPCGKSWCFCTATESARRGRCEFSRPMAATLSRS